MKRPIALPDELGEWQELHAGQAGPQESGGGQPTGPSHGHAPIFPVRRPALAHDEEDQDAKKFDEQERGIDRKDRQGHPGRKSGGQPRVPPVLQPGSQPEEDRPPAEGEIDLDYPCGQAAGKRARQGDPGAHQPAGPGASPQRPAQAHTAVDRDGLVQEYRNGDPAVDPQEQHEVIWGIERRRLDVGLKGAAKAYEWVPKRQMAPKEALSKVRLVEDVHPHEIIAVKEIGALQHEPDCRECRNEQRTREKGGPGAGL